MPCLTPRTCPPSTEESLAQGSGRRARLCGEVNEWATSEWATSEWATNEWANEWASEWVSALRQRVGERVDCKGVGRLT